MNDFPFTDRRNNPPMPLEEYERQAWQSARQVFVSVVMAGLLWTGAVWPWKPVLVNVGFCVAFLAGAWLLTGRRAR